MGARVRYVLSVTLEPKARIGTNVPAQRVPKGPAPPAYKTGQAVSGHP